MVKCPDNCVDLRELKTLVRDHSPEDSMLRKVILREHDFVERELFAGMCIVWVRLLFIEYPRK